MKVIKNLICHLLLLMGVSYALQSQTIIPQKLPFVKICAQSDFNSFEANFKHSGFPVSTSFVVELSDKDGNFTSPIATQTLATSEVSSSEKTITFAIPTTIIGSENYKLRVKSSTGVASTIFNTFDLKTSFPVYYKPYSQSFYINKQKASSTLCNGGNINLSIDNPTPNVPSSSPANFLELKYKWYKNNLPIAGATASTLNVSEAGIYYAELDYGSCSDVNFRSQAVTVTQIATNAAIVTSSLSNPFCASTGATTLTATAGNSYIWKKDAVVIPGATSQTYQTISPGLYSVAIDLGGCQVSATIALTTLSFTSSLSIPQNSTLSFGDSKVVQVLSNALNPEYKWYINTVLIPNANSSTYNLTTTGDYKVEITQTAGCHSTNEILFTINPSSDVNAIAIPNLISPNNDGINDLWSIPQDYSSGTNTEVIILDSTGKIVLKTNDYQNNWPENKPDFTTVNPVYYYIITTNNGTVKRGSITIVK